MMMNRVLITGAAGAIGRVLREGLAGRYPVLRLTDRVDLGPAGDREELVQADLCDLPAVTALVRDCDAIVHLAGIPEEADWKSIHDANLIGTYHVYEAARIAGVKRVVFASSNHVIGFYRRDQRVGPRDPMRPDTRYGLSKAFGELLARFYADKFGIESVCLRIGSFRPEPTDRRMLSIWISHRDTVELVARALEAPHLVYEIVYGVSDNDRGWWDNPGATTIGFTARDNAETFAGKIEQLSAELPIDAVADLFHGGAFCSTEFSNDVDNVK